MKEIISENKWKLLKFLFLQLPIGIFIYVQIIYFLADRIAAEKCLEKGTTGYVVTFNLETYCTGVINNLSFANKLSNYYPDQHHDLRFFDNIQEK